MRFLQQNRNVSARGRRRGVLILLATAAGACLLGVTPQAAHAADGPSMTIDSPQPDQFISGSVIHVSGTATSGGAVDVSASSGDRCSAQIVDSQWTCALTAPSGTVTVNARMSAAATSGSAEASPSQTPAQTTAQTPSPTPTPALTPAASSASVVVHVLTAPAVTGSTPIVTKGSFSGEGFPNAGIELQLTPTNGGAGATFACPVVGSDGRWSCVTTPQEGDYGLAVTQFVPGTPADRSPASASVPVTVDLTPPPPPTLTSPTNGQQVSTAPIITGSGEDGDNVAVYLDGLQDCLVPVSGGVWTCTTSELRPGNHTVQALQFDPAGNFSAMAPAITVTVASPATASSGPGTSAPGSSAPGSSAPGSPAHSPGHSGAPDSSPAPDIPSGDSGATPPTTFGAALPTISAAAEGGSVLAALMLALAFVALVAIPARGLASTARAHLRAPQLRVFGRNRRSSPEQTMSRSERIAAMACAVVAASVLAATAASSETGNSPPALILSVTAGVLVLNATAPLALIILGRRAAPSQLSVHAHPELLIAGLVAAVVSHAVDIHPAALLGVVLILRSADPTESTTPRRVAVAIAQPLLLLVISLGALFAHNALVGDISVWAVGVSEAAATICVGGLVSGVVLLLPLGRLPGNALLRESRLAWVLLALISTALTAMVLFDGFDVATMATVVISVGIAAVCAALIAWIRWVEPR